VILSTNTEDIITVDNYFDYKLTADIEKVFTQFKHLLKDDNSVSLQDVIDYGIFYMSSYFIRFIQFRRLVSKEHGMFSMIMAIIWLNKLL
jgi:hypothetical protein